MRNIRSMFINSIKNLTNEISVLKDEAEGLYGKLCAKKQELFEEWNLEEEGEVLIAQAKELGDLYSRGLCRIYRCVDSEPVYVVSYNGKWEYVNEDLIPIVLGKRLGEDTIIDEYFA